MKNNAMSIFEYVKYLIAYMHMPLETEDLNE